MQMFAFCPNTRADQCGVTAKPTETDFVVTNDSPPAPLILEAGLDKQTITLEGSNALTYVEGLPEVRRYSSCYYQI